MKLVVGDDSGWIEAAVFDEEIQTRMAMLNGPTNFIFKIKSTSKKV